MKLIIKYFGLGLIVGLYLITAAIIITGCEYKTKPTNETKVKVLQNPFRGDTIDVIKIITDDRGCEYLLVEHSNGVAIVHLPKCRNHF